MFGKFFRATFKNPPGIPNYQVAPRYDISGAAQFVMQPEFTQPILAFTGTGKIPRRSIMATQEVPLYYTFRGIQSGLGGIQAGQFALSPLTDETGGQ